MNCPEDKPCIWIVSGNEIVCGHCGRSKPTEEIHRNINEAKRRALNMSVAAIECGGIDR